jgi:serine/threonine protein kinase
MPEFMQAHAQAWLEEFRRRGYRDVAPLAAGVEGAVYDLGDSTVAKVWRQRREAGLTLMQEFYADVIRGGLPFATPEILTVDQIDGTAVTVERKLPGQPLQSLLGSDDRQLSFAAAGCVIEVLQALASVRGTANMRRLPVLDEERSFWADSGSFPSALQSLLHRRVTQFGDVLRRRLPGFDRRFAGLLERLPALEELPDTVVHGDLVPGNILVTEDLRPLAVLDFGFLTTAGDPRFDAAIAAAVMNMYGPHAPAIVAELTRRIATELGYPAELLLTYQAAYAVATSNAFTRDGSDGHFAWCIAQLERTDIAAMLA